MEWRGIALPKRVHTTSRQVQVCGPGRFYAAGEQSLSTLPEEPPSLLRPRPVLGRRGAKIENIRKIPPRIVDNSIGRDVERLLSEFAHTPG